MPPVYITQKSARFLTLFCVFWSVFPLLFSRFPPIFLPVITNLYLIFTNFAIKIFKISKQMFDTDLLKARVSSRWELPNGKHLFSVPVGWATRVCLVCQKSFAFGLAVCIRSCCKHRVAHNGRQLLVPAIFHSYPVLWTATIRFGFCAQSYSSVSVVTGLWDTRQEQNILIFLFPETSRAALEPVGNGDKTAG
jgi:hypothetical protein